MNEKILVPELGESITEATISKWLKNIGDLVTVDEALVELETDKVNIEVPSPINGVLSEINSKDGDTVAVGSILGIISASNIKTNDLINSDEAEKINNLEKKNNTLKLKENNNEKVEPLVLGDEVPLILNNEVKKEENDPGSNLSPAVRKIVTEKKNRYFSGSRDR